MPSEPVEGVVFGRLFTFSPPTRASQLRPIDDRPVSVASPLNNITLVLTINKRLFHPEDLGSWTQRSYYWGQNPGAKTKFKHPWFKYIEGDLRITRIYSQIS